MVRFAKKKVTEKRIEFSVDVAQAISGVFGGGKGKSPLAKHIEQLEGFAERMSDG